MFKTIKKYRAHNIIEVEVYKYNGKLVFIKRLTNDLDADKLIQELRIIEYHIKKRGTI
jgi:hypothetical protein